MNKPKLLSVSSSNSSHGMDRSAGFCGGWLSINSNFPFGLIRVPKRRAHLAAAQLGDATIDADAPDVCRSVLLRPDVSESDDSTRSWGDTHVPQDQWQVLLHDRHPAYITWEEFEHNLAQIQENRSQSQRRGSVRQGRAILAGLIVCGRCGCRMMTRYQGKASQPRYVCDSRRANYGDRRCQSASAIVIDEEVVRLALLALEPAALEVSLRVAHDVEHQRSQLETHWCQRLERATFEADRARRQFDAVEPENRLVARTLELTWKKNSTC